MKVIVKYFFLGDFFFLVEGIIIDLDNYIFPWQACFLGVVLDWHHLVFR